MSTAVAAEAMPGHVVMLGQPEAVIAQPLRVAGQIQAVFQRLLCGRTLDNRGQIENGELCHPRDIGDVRPKR
jgi:hypothetical protein